MRRRERKPALWGSLHGCQIGSAEDRRRQQRLDREWQRRQERIRTAVLFVRVSFVVADFERSMARIQRALSTTPEELTRLAFFAKSWR